jgi:hypothetical protein
MIPNKLPHILPSDGREVELRPQQIELLDQDREDELRLIRERGFCGHAHIMAWHARLL